MSPFVSPCGVLEYVIVHVLEESTSFCKSFLIQAVLEDARSSDRSAQIAAII